MESVEFILGSVTDRKLVDELVSSTDAVLHFAAESHVDRSILDSTKFIETNILGTDILLNAALRHSKTIVLISTDEVYGSLASEDASESFPLMPSSPYSASKSAADLLGLAFLPPRTDVRITRAANNYGNSRILKNSYQIYSGNSVWIGNKLYGNGRKFVIGCTHRSL